MQRRTFLGSSALAGVVGWFRSAVLSASPVAAQQKTTAASSPGRPQKRILTGHYDLIVVGGGLSGVSAAISAARNGAKTALVQDRPMLGGNSSSEVRLVPEFNNWITPWAKETGIIEEFYAEDRHRNHEPWMEGMVNVLWDLTLLEAVKREPNITLYLDTSVRDVTMKNPKRIEGIEAVQIGSEQDIRLTADLFIDASGLGSLGYFAGADFVWGREGRKAFNESFQPEEPDDQTMGSTMYFRAFDAHRPIPFQPPEWAARYPTEESLGQMRSHPWLECGYYWQEVGSPLHTIFDNEKIRQEQLRQVLGVWDHIKNQKDHGAQNYALEWLSAWPYRRENRRLLGDYIMTQHDIQDATVHEDRVAFGSWPIDIHPPGGILKAPAPPVDSAAAPGANPYTIPLRSLYSRNIENLLMAGRPISCTWIAFASTRILPTGAMLGQAAGAAAALCKRHGILPRALKDTHLDELQQTLIKQDQYIPQVSNHDAADLARSARVAASSEAKLEFPEPNGATDAIMPLAQIFPVSGDRLDSVELLLESSAPGATKVKLALRNAANLWDFSSAEDLAVAEATVPPRATSWIPFTLNARVKPNRLYLVTIDTAQGIRWKSFDDNYDIHYFLDRAENEDFWDIWKSLPPKVGGVPPGTLPAMKTDALLQAGGLKYQGGRRWTQLFKVFESALRAQQNPQQQGRPRKEPSPQSIRSVKVFCMRLHPESTPYGAGNVISGVARPESWTNIWISDPHQTLPQWVQCELPAARTFNSVYLTFDTDLSFAPEFPLHVPPECVRDYEVSCATATGWKTLVQAKGNYQRRRIHRFDPVQSDKLRLTVHATNGAPSARVYEIRIYNE